MTDVDSEESTSTRLSGDDDDDEDFEEDEVPEEEQQQQQQPDEKKDKINLPKSSKEVYKMFTLSTTNQILRGVSPTSPRFSRAGLSRSEKERLLRKELREKRKNQGWMELIASELYSANVTVVPRPAEGDWTRVSRDPRRGRYCPQATLPHQHLCKLVRKRLIRDILHKHNLVSAQAKIDTRLGRKLPNRRQLERWKRKRASHTEHWHRRRRCRHRRKTKTKKRRVISTKRKRPSPANVKCPTCGDYHFRRQPACGSLGIGGNLAVRQILQKTDVIKQHMGEAWDKLDSLEEAYRHVLLKVHRLQSNRVCVGLLTGQEYPGERHPDSCPCSVQRLRDQEDERRQEERNKIEEKARRELEEKREGERIKREELLEVRKRRFYSRMRQQQQQQQHQESSNDLTRLDEARTIVDDEGGGGLEERSLGLIQRAAASSNKYRTSDLIVMDGKVKSICPEFTEYGGLILESVTFDSVPEVEEELNTLEQAQQPHVEEEEVALPEMKSCQSSPRSERAPSSTMAKSLTPFGDFLDIMEVF